MNKVRVSVFDLSALVSAFFCLSHFSFWLHLNVCLYPYSLSLVYTYSKLSLNSQKVSIPHLFSWTTVKFILGE